MTIHAASVRSHVVFALAVAGSVVACRSEPSPSAPPSAATVTTVTTVTSAAAPAVAPATGGPSIKECDELFDFARRCAATEKGELVAQRADWSEVEGVRAFIAEFAREADSGNPRAAAAVREAGNACLEQLAKFKRKHPTCDANQAVDTVDGKPFVIADVKVGAPISTGERAVFLSEAPLDCKNLRGNGARTIALLVPWKAGRFDASQLTKKIDHRTVLGAALVGAPDVELGDLHGTIEPSRVADRAAHVRVDLDWARGNGIHRDLDVTACPDGAAAKP